MYAMSGQQSIHMERNKYVLTPSLSTVLECLNLCRCAHGIPEILELFYMLSSPLVNYLLPITKVSKGKNFVVQQFRDLLTSWTLSPITKNFVYLIREVECEMAFGMQLLDKQRILYPYAII